jgi:hypothetical protein
MNYEQSMLWPVIPAKAGTQGKRRAVALDPRFRGGDGKILGWLASFQVRPYTSSRGQRGTRCGGSDPEYRGEADDRFC